MCHFRAFTAYSGYGDVSDTGLTPDYACMTSVGQSLSNYATLPSQPIMEQVPLDVGMCPGSPANFVSLASR